MPTWGGGLSCAGELLEFSSEWYWCRKIRWEGGGGGGGGGGGHHFNGKIEHLGVAKYWWDSLAYCVASGACSDCTMAMSTSLGKY